VPYETVDGAPVRIFFMLVGPESEAGAHVKAISRISRLVRHELVRVHLLEAGPGSSIACCATEGVQ
jgi:PTS system nitrogen regulatory IIA component